MTDFLVSHFGRAAPSKVLEFISRAAPASITYENSSEMELGLLQAPYRTFSNAALSKKVDVCVCNVSYKSTSQYFTNRALRDTITTLRNDLLTSQDKLVILYNQEEDQFVGNLSVEGLIGLIENLKSGSATISAHSAAQLQALSLLDCALAKQLADKKKTVVVVGSGGREHALAVALAKSPRVGEVLVCPGNGGTAKDSNPKIRNVGANQANDTVAALCKEYNVDMCVVGPEQPLVDGLVDHLAVECPSVLAFGPTQAAAQLEASKAYTKDFLQEFDIPTATYKNFTDVNEALEYVNSLKEGERVVVKASGLAAGKGVLLPETKEETLAAVHEIMSDKSFGSAGDTCVIESFMTGPEASCLAFCDGKTAKLMPAAQDHKRALDGDQGLNTGGMGAYAPAPCVTPALQTEIEAMCQKTVTKMAEERGIPYVGILYAGMMLTPSGPSVVEFNCRFGDPETQVLLPLLENDLYEVFEACCTQKLDEIDVRFRENTAAATVVCAAKGYPEAYPKGMLITGLDNQNDNVKVYHAGTKLNANNDAVCSGGRVLAVTGMGANLDEALKASYATVTSLDFVDEKTGDKLMHYRTDIAYRAKSPKLRIGVLGSTRGTALTPVIDACESGQLHAEIVAVVSNKKDAGILEKGKALGVTVATKFVPSKGLSREEFDAECSSVLKAAGVDLILCVGYMRILSKSFCQCWAGRCVNVHPSLLPKHAGGMDLAVHQAVIDAKEDESGCTIHMVTEEVDGGPIVLQKKVQVTSDDTAESLKAKVQPFEGPAFIEAIEICAKSILGKKSISYADAGVSIDAGNSLVDMIKPACKSTKRSGCDADLGGFGGLFDLAAAGFDSADTVLIGATDGVGTKLRIAQTTKNHNSVGIDLVAMCVNDLIVAGGEPLFFLDYFATGKLDVNEAAAVVEGIAEGCRQSGCGLIGGETAEMPSMYAPGDYDLAGFSVGAVHRDCILPKNVSAGDVVLGLTSSGVHSNGFSLVRKLLESEKLSYSDACPWDSEVASVGDALLTPTKIYVKACLPLLKKKLLTGLAHITGGGLLENLPRSLPKGVNAKISGHPALPPTFKWMQKVSCLDDTEMLRTFNCGIGMCLLAKPEHVDQIKQLLKENGEEVVYDLGVLVENGGIDPEVIMEGSLG